MKKIIQAKYMLIGFILLIIFAIFITVFINFRYSSLQNVQDQILTANENEIKLSSEISEAENEIVLLSIINPFDNSISKLKAKINKNLFPEYNEHVEILNKITGNIFIDWNYGKGIRPSDTEYMRTSKNIYMKTKLRLARAKSINESNRVKSLILLRQALNDMHVFLDTQYHHKSGTQLIHYDVILDNFEIDYDRETLLNLIETMYEYDRAEEHANAYYYFMLYNEEGKKLLDELLKPIVKEKQEEARNKYNETRKVSDDLLAYDYIQSIESMLKNGDSELRRKKYEEAYATFENIIKKAEEYIKNTIK